MTTALEKQGIKAKFAVWLITPKAERLPPFKAAFARENGVTKQTLKNWERELSCNEQEQHEFRMRAIKDMLFHEATEKGKVNAAELYAKITGELVDRNETKVSLELNADQIEKVRQEAEQRVRQEVKRINGRVDGLPDEPVILFQ